MWTGYSDLLYSSCISFGLKQKRSLKPSSRAELVCHLLPGLFPILMNRVPQFGLTVNGYSSSTIFRFFSSFSDSIS